MGTWSARATMMRRLACWLVLVLGASTLQAAEPIPHGQSSPPNSPLSPDEAVARMTLPDGFRAEVVASEPQIVNPVAMTFDERGRIWITESLEYPRRAPGAGRDRIKILEDTDGDGKADSFTTFAEGLNIPSGIAVGHGGVWVANSPDILFLKDTDGDGKADTREVVVTGFGRDDTHELPNSLTWGPDGWLYGWNGVFNASHVRYRGKDYRFTCAIFRIHPRTRDFELFCEGTSNPWGIAWNLEGEAFASACVIDHLWHLTETGYYHRQGGPYPPFTWKIESIVDHTHQKAAYCGIHFFDSAAYPVEYRERLYMGNIHGNCVNVDRLERKGSTYQGIAAPDFLRANDAWFMPVSQKTGPDGCLYVLDWYDRYHCYQDANRDPAGIDRLKGRLYRIRYKDTPRRARFDLAKESDQSLIQLLASPNVYDRDIAQRLLTERNAPATRPALQSLVLDEQASRKARMHALWALVGGGALDVAFHKALLDHADSTLRAWGVRAAGNMHRVDPVVRDKVAALAHDLSPRVMLQVAIAARKIEGLDALPVLLEVLSRCGNDPLIPHIVWQNLHPLLEDETQAIAFVRGVSRTLLDRAPALASILPRAVERLLARRGPGHVPIATIFRVLQVTRSEENVAASRRILEVIAAQLESGELNGRARDEILGSFRPAVDQIVGGPTDSPLWFDAALLSTSWKNERGLRIARLGVEGNETSAVRRLRALDALVGAGDPEVLPLVSRLLGQRDRGAAEFRGQVLAALGKLDDPRVGQIVLKHYPGMEPDLQPKAIELLTQRTSWSRALVNAIRQSKVPADVLNVNQIRKLLQSKDAELTAQVKVQWGTIREGRNPEREKVITSMRRFLNAHPGDPTAGSRVFQKLCAQCHKIHGEGQDVGPDLTRNGRGSYDQLLSNVFDPSLVIGSAYQATTVAAVDGRVLTGLVVEDNPQRLVLKLQGGKLETLPREQVEDLKVSPLSLMPEDLEKQLKPEELADLFAFITLDKPPTDQTARPIPGAASLHIRATEDPHAFASILSRVAPGFTTSAVGEGGLALLPEFRGRTDVLRTHPVDQNTPCVLTATIDVPAGKKTRLLLDVAHDPRGDWRLIVKANGKTLHDQPVSPSTTRGGWATVAVDLSSEAGKSVKLELQNAPTGWSWEFGYWGRIQIVSK